MHSRIIAALALSLLLTSGTSLMAQKELIKAQANECMQAIVRGDFEKLAERTHPSLVMKMGGAQQMVQSLRKTYETMKKQGFSFDSGYVEDVSRIVSTKRRRFAIVPYMLYITTPEGTIPQPGSIVGISEDNSRSWTFVDINENTASMLAMLFPDEKNLAKTLSLSSGSTRDSRRSK